MLVHAYGQSAFDSEEIRAYGSLEELTASDILQGVPNREKSLSQLWEGSQMLANPQSIDQPETTADEALTNTEK